MERDASQAERDTAGWTKWLAITTVVLAIATTGAIFVPLISATTERKKNQIAALRQLRQIIRLFWLRTSFLGKEPGWSAHTLLQGLDVALGRALSDDMARALPPSIAYRVYGALFTAHDAITTAIHRQLKAPANGRIYDDIKADANDAASKLMKASQEIEETLAVLTGATVEEELARAK